jgi:hypothetical protein
MGNSIGTETAMFTRYLTGHMTYCQLPSISTFYEPKSMPYNGDKDSYLTKSPNEIAFSLWAYEQLAALITVTTQTAAHLG